MRAYPLFVILTLSLTLCHAGDLRISRTTLRGKDAAKAQEEALKVYKPIAIVYSDPESKNKDVIKATKTVMTSLNASTVLIFVDSTDVNELPKDALQQVQGAQAGKGLPKTVILKPNLYTVVGILPATYDSGNLTKLMAIAKKRIQAVSKTIRKDEVERKAKLQKAHQEAEKLLRGY